MQRHPGKKHWAGQGKICHVQGSWHHVPWIFLFFEFTGKDGTGFVLWIYLMCNGSHKIVCGCVLSFCFVFLLFVWVIIVKGPENNTSIKQIICNCGTKIYKLCINFCSVTFIDICSSFSKQRGLLLLAIRKSSGLRYFAFALPFKTGGYILLYIWSIILLW